MTAAYTASVGLVAATDVKTDRAQKSVASSPQQSPPSSPATPATGSPPEPDMWSQRLWKPLSAELMKEDGPQGVVAEVDVREETRPAAPPSRAHVAHQ
ncbi:yciC, partial [Symbiodinium microadriaticum]